MSLMLLASLLVLILITSHVIVWVSARSWCETAFEGGWRHAGNWVVMVMSALCATWCYGTTFLLLITYFFGLTLSTAPPWIENEVQSLVYELTPIVMRSMNFGRGIAILPVLCGFGALALNSWAILFRGRNLIRGDGYCADVFVRMYGQHTSCVKEGRIVTAIKTVYLIVYAALFLLWPSALSGGFTTYKVFQYARKVHVRKVAHEFEAEHLLHELA